VEVNATEMNRMPVYHLISKRASVEASTWTEQYGGDAYPWAGTLVYDGEVYDHIHYRARGGVWRYAMRKNMWKFDFNKGHDFEARDNFGKKYTTPWAKLNLGANIQQGDYQHRGEQGMFESIGLKLFNLAGVEGPNTHYIQFRIIDENAETGATQYTGDFWGVYLALEQEDGRFLDEHRLPDGNLYKMEGGTGELNNLGRSGPGNKSDLNAFLNTYRGSAPSDDWWRQNFDAERYFSYQAIVQGIHHYDICYGKNYFYYRDPETLKWSVHPWDLDLTWADNMYDAGCGGVDDLKNRVANNAGMALGFKNRVREIRDLLFNSDQAGQLIDEYARIAKGTNPGPTLLDADRMMWDYNPIMAGSGKAGTGLFYKFPLENVPAKGTFEAVPALMKAYVAKRSVTLDQLSADAAIPSKPTLAAPLGIFPANRVVLKSSPYSGQAPFSKLQFRIGEITPQSTAGIPNKYEIEPVWLSPELASFSEEVTVPSGILKVGHAYRARARMKDSSGRTSQWSEPVQFVAAEPDSAVSLQENLIISELM
jgi:hypothetical protein